MGAEKVCGGLISPDTQEILARYGLSLPKDVLASPQLFSVKTIDLKDGYTKYYRRNYINVSRHRFDEFMRSMIPEDVGCIQGRCVRIGKTENGYCVTVRSNGVDTSYECRYLIGADGASSVVRRELFPDKRIYSYVAIQQWFKAEGEDPFYSCVFDNETSSGCSWIFFKDGKMIFGGAFEPCGCREAFETQKNKLERLGIVEGELIRDPIKTEACRVLRPKLFRGIYLGKGGAFLCGEAAGLISPSSFEGISYALESSEALADAFARSWEKKLSIERAYRSAVLSLRIKIALKCIKRPFMYDSTLRRSVMTSGLMAIKMRKDKSH